jgi:hypothetical protein
LQKELVCRIGEFSKQQLFENLPDKQIKMKLAREITDASLILFISKTTKVRQV